MSEIRISVNKIMLEDTGPKSVAAQHTRDWKYADSSAFFSCYSLSHFKS